MSQEIDQFAEPKKTFKFPLWTIISSIILAILVGVSFLIPQFLDQEQYRGLIQTKIKEASGYDVTWKGDIGLMILPLPTATINNAEVSYGGHKFLTIDQAEIRVALMPLFEKSIEVSSVTLEKTNLVLVTDKNGVNLWEAKKPETVVDTNSTTKSPSSAPAFKIGSVKLSDALITIDNQQTKSKQTISDLNISLGLNDLKGPFDIKGNATYNNMPSVFDIILSALPEAGKPSNLKGVIELPKYGAIAKLDQNFVMGDVLSSSGDLNLTIKDLGEIIKNKKLPKGIGSDFSLNTKISYNGNSILANALTLKTGSLQYVGSVAVSNLTKGQTPLVKLNLQSKSNIKGDVDVLVKFLADLSINATASFANNTLTLQNTNLNLNDQMIALNGMITLPKDKDILGLNLTLSSPRLDFDDLQKKYALPTESAAQKASQDKDTKTVAIKGFSIPFKGSLNASIGTLTSGGREFSNVKMNIQNSGQHLTISNLSLNAFSGTSLLVKGSITDTQNLSGLNLNIDAKTNNAEQLAQSLSITLPKLNQPLGAVSLVGNFSGSLQSLNFNATTGIWGFGITGKGNVAELLSKPIIKELNARVTHPNTSTAASIFAKGFTPPKSFKGGLNLTSNVTWDKDQYRLTGLMGTIGSTSINGGLTFTGGKIPTLNGSLILGAVELDSNAPKPSASSSSSASASTARWSREAINTAWMRSFNADLAIEAQSLTQGQWRFDKPKFSFALSNGTLNIREMSAGLFGGTALLNGTMNAGASDRDPLSISGKLNAKNISAEKLHSAVSNKPQDIFKGVINNFDLSVNANGISPAALVQSLSGKGDMNGQNIVIKGVDAGKLAEAARGSFKPLERAGGLYQSFQEGSTKFDTMNVAFGITSGVVNFSEIKFDGQTSSIISQGNLNLPRWTIDLNNKMTVKNTDIPPFEFKISGPLDSPLQTGGSIIENYLKQRAMKKIETEVTKQLEKHLGGELGGILGGALGIQKPKTETAPTATTPQNETVPSEQTPASDPVPVESEAPKTKEEAIGNIIADPSNIKTDDAVKALEGLFGQ